MKSSTFSHNLTFNKRVEDASISKLSDWKIRSRKHSQCCWFSSQNFSATTKETLNNSFLNQYFLEGMLTTHLATDNNNNINHFAFKFLIDFLHSHGFCSLYSFVQKHEREVWQQRKGQTYMAAKHQTGSSNMLRITLITIKGLLKEREHFME